MSDNKKNKNHRIYGFSALPTLGKDNVDFMKSVCKVESAELRIIVLAEALLLGEKLRNGTRGNLRKQGVITVMDILRESCNYMIDAAKTIENEDLVKGFNMALDTVKLLTHAYSIEIKG
ncbi:MAG: hypothetical protein P9L97_10730 [Candidatus Tenebribacter davisii]|nr:hypothetical protein [Candidatus Tenebribacter davisii]